MHKNVQKPLFDLTILTHTLSQLKQKVQYNEPVATTVATKAVIPQFL